MANEPPATTTAGHVSLIPRQPSIIAMIQNSTMMVIKRQLTPHHLANLKAVDACYLVRRPDSNTHRTKCHWRGVNNQAQPGGVQRFKAQTDQQCGGNCYWCAKACSSFEERAETETDDQHLQALVWGYRKNRRANDVKLPGFHRDLIDEHCCNNDPRDGPQTVEEAIITEASALATGIL